MSGVSLVLAVLLLVFLLTNSHAKVTEDSQCRMGPLPRNIVIAATRSGYPGPMADPVVPPFQGTSAKVQQIGILKSVTGRKHILPLMGAQRERRRDTWLYYTFKDGNALIKLPVFYNKKDCTGEYGCDRISTNDTVFVEGYDEAYRAVVYSNSCFNYVT